VADYVGRSDSGRRKAIITQYIVNAVDKCEILTLQDNYIEITAGDNSEIIARAAAVKVSFSSDVPLGFLAFLPIFLLDHVFSLLYTLPMKKQLLIKDLGVTKNVN